jgi:hypothetical protein
MTNIDGIPINYPILKAKRFILTFGHHGVHLAERKIQTLLKPTINFIQRD